MHNYITLLYSTHYDAKCSCSYCTNKKGIIKALENLNYKVKVKKFNCDWEYFHPAIIHFDYALLYQNKLFGGFMFEADKLPRKLIEFAETFFDYIICSSKFLYDTWVSSGVESKYLLRSSLGLDTSIFKKQAVIEPLYPDKFKFLSIGNWQHVKEWQDRKGLELVIDIFNKNFKNNDKVMLILKTDRNCKQKSNKKIKIIKEYLTDNELAALYNSCSINGACIQLHRGEGFGRVHLEALHCGCRLGTTNWSGVLDFATNKNSTLFNYKLIDSIIYDKEYYNDNQYPKFADVDYKEVENWMLKVSKSSKINKYSFKETDYTWETIIKKLMLDIEKIL